MTNFAEAWEAVVTSPLFGITLTLGAFWLAQWLAKLAKGRAWANPVLVAMVLVAIALAILGVSYDDYMVGGKFIAFLLGPATVSLGLPLYRQASKVVASAPMVLVSVTVGSIVGVLSGYWVTRWLGGTHPMALSMAPKSTTTPISLALSEQIGGIPALSAIFTIVAGVVGAILAPGLLNVLRIKDARARGIAIGVSSHGVGTARALEESETAGAFSGLALGLTGLITSLVIGVTLALTGAG